MIPRALYLSFKMLVESVKLVEGFVVCRADGDGEVRKAWAHHHAPI